MNNLVTSPVTKSICKDANINLCMQKKEEIQRCSQDKRASRKNILDQSYNYLERCFFFS